MSESFTFAIDGLGRIGQYVLGVYIKDKKFCLENNEKMDMKCVGIIRREAKPGEEIAGLPIVTNVHDLPVRPDVVIQTKRSEFVMPIIEQYLKWGFCTVDSLDDRGLLFDSLDELGKLAKIYKACGLNTGFCPGIYSTGMAIGYRINPWVKSTINYGPGKSMGHSGQAATVMERFGIEDPKAVSITDHFHTDAGVFIPGKHQRDLYIEVDNAELKAALLAHKYFVDNDEQHTDIHVVDDVTKYDTKTHGGYLLSDDKESVKLEMDWKGDNGEFTARALYSGARCMARYKRDQKYGYYLDSMIAQMDCVKGVTISDRLKRARA